VVHVSEDTKDIGLRCKKHNYYKRITNTVKTTATGDALPLEVARPPSRSQL